MMTAQELILTLQKYPPDTQVHLGLSSDMIPDFNVSLEIEGTELSEHDNVLELSATFRKDDTPDFVSPYPYPGEDEET